MQLEQQVCSLELAKRLKELGVSQESLFGWNKTISGYVKLESSTHDRRQFENVFGSVIEYTSAFTVAELGEMLPENHITMKKFGVWQGRKTGEDFKLISECDTEADSRAKMLIYLLENKII